MTSSARYQPLVQLLSPSSPSLRRLLLPVLALVVVVFAISLLLVAAYATPAHLAAFDALDRVSAFLSSWRSSVLPDGEYVPPSQLELRALVGDNPKFLVKDNHAAYGYNNVRYMFESTLNLATLTGRIPVIPDAIWSRRCAVSDWAVCDAHALQHYADRNAHAAELGVSWNEDGGIWKIGIEQFLDLPHLRQSYGPFLTTSEFFTLFGLDPSLIHPSGHWNVTRYQPPEASVAVLENTEFESGMQLRVDREGPHWGEARNTGMTEEAGRGREWLGTGKVLTEDVVREKLSALEESEGVEQWMRKAGFVPLYTFSDEVIMNKALLTPSTEYAPVFSLLSLHTTTSLPPFHTAKILYLPGDLHDQRKPGALRFSTPAARDAFASTVLRSVWPPRKVRELGRTMADRFAASVNGRRWVAAHMRRGDFVMIQWAPEKDALVHFTRTREALDQGIKELGNHYLSEELPLPSDPFFLATDEDDEAALAYYRSRNAVTLRDFMTASEKAAFGWPSDFVDLLAVVEQQILARADYFVGSRLSSTTGGALNIRGALGGARSERWSWSLL